MNDSMEKLKSVCKLLNSEFKIWSYSNKASVILSRLLSFECPHRECQQMFKSQKELKAHINEVHKLELCEICLDHKKVFSFEYQLFTKTSLRQHIDPSRKDSTKSNYTKDNATCTTDGIGHPLCDFCRIRFYSEDELYHHCEQHHETCFICKRRQPLNPSYFKSMAELVIHFCTKSLFVYRKIILKQSILHVLIPSAFKRDL